MDKLRAALVIEILGRPPEHVKKAVEGIVSRLGSEKGVRIVNRRLHNPIKAENSKNLFTAFAEVEVELDSLDQYFGIIFAYMPSHIEIITPDKITISNAHLSELANTLTQRLHNYDSIAKRIIVERNALLRKLHEIAPNLFKKKKESNRK